MSAILLAALAGLAAAPPPRAPAPMEDGLQPPMTFACHLSGRAGEAHVQGRISRYYLKVAPGMGLMVMAEPGGYRDHVVLEIQPSPIPGLAGRYDLDARFPLESDNMILALPATAGSGGYVLTASPVKFGVGYQAFTSLQVERAGAPAASWTGTCATTLPKPGRKPS